MDRQKELACLCALNRIFGFDPKSAIALIRHFGSAHDVFMAGPKAASAVLGPFSRHQMNLDRDMVSAAQDELASLERKGIRFTGWTAPEYPPLLKECEDAPIGLYIRTSSALDSLWGTRKSIAVVGTRDISPYGKEWCSKAVTAMATSREKPVIVSGLALGTDILAHVTAVEHGLPTIAVMATGADMIYPHRHKAFAERIAYTPGCALVTDYPPGTPPLAIHFLRRNRIIAGLSDATVLIESKIKGGGMMTCNLAFSYSRDVLALPGRPDDLRSQGCNLLIRNRIAEPFFSCKELTESLGLTATGRRQDKRLQDIVTHVYSGRTHHLEAMRKAAAAIEANRGISIEDIALCTGIEYRMAAHLTGMLEADGYICIDLLQRCCINKAKLQQE